jgi:hypothetical protein
MFVPYDAILVDEGAAPFDVETYLTRIQAKIARKREVELLTEQQQVRNDQLEFEETSLSYSSRDATGPLSHAFPDFAELYDGENFTSLAETTEFLLEHANEQMEALKNHLRSEGGFTVIRIRDPVKCKMIATRCILLPSTAFATWGWDFNRKTEELLDACFREFSLEYMERYENVRDVMSLFHLKRIGIDAPEREFFRDVPLWKMEIMLKKWRTDRALKQWIDEYKFKQ